MRVRIIFSLNNKGGAVPFHHQYLLSEFIEKVIASEAPEYSDYKFYNFSGIKGQTKVGKGGLHFYSNKVTLVFACQEEALVKKLLKGIFKKNLIEIGQLILTPESVEKEKEIEFTDETKFICISPMVIADTSAEIAQDNRFVNPTDDTFSDMLFDSVIARMEDFGFSLEELESFSKFQVLPDANYLNKMKRNDKKFSRIYPVFLEGGKSEVRGYTFPFTLFADKKVQKFVFETGFGEYAHKGLGMLDVANVDPIGRVEPYEFND